MTNTSKKRGRPTLLNRRIINQLAHAAQSGKTREEMAAHAGVAVRTLQTWIAQGRKAREQVLAQGGRATGPAGAQRQEQTVDQLALHLAVALDVADRKRRGINAILSGEELERGVPKGVKPIGRPAILTQSLVDAVAGPCAANRLDKAAAAAGVDRRSVQRWLTRGRNVHLSGGATTEYERLCGVLYARVEAASGEAEPEPAEEAPAAKVPAGTGSTFIVLTEDRVEQLVGAVADGANRLEAASRAGVSYRTFARWLALGARVNAAGAHASEHERLCGVLKNKVAEADHARAAGPDASPGLFAVGGTVDTEGLARKLGEKPGHVLPSPSPVAVTRTGARSPKRWALLGRRFADRLGFRRLARV
ncbi:hypothetical protein OHS33_39075 (plasmid) [Streptomyces sp. NBC_00536]|uniref:hypothetical protein n=1 Tax=Streptomyces sp. NBC_00536 TaxID=2975769 RepID=UPI002E808603|nr:hypothetical protein [Streptomyces sp. NBC_00536]WUC84362.1 hypothetical protein OHS33_39075 [Streptomyces sp. NBC_00536]